MRNYLSQLRRFYGAFVQGKLVGVITSERRNPHRPVLCETEIPGAGIERQVIRGGTGKASPCENDGPFLAPMPFPFYHKLGFRDTDTEQVVNDLAVYTDGTDAL